MNLNYALESMLHRIDSICNTHNVNKNIITEISNNIDSKVKENLGKSKKKRQLLKEYEIYLSEYKQLIEKQMKEIDDILNEEEQYNVDILPKLKKELHEKSTQSYIEEYKIMIDTIDEKEKDLYCFSHIYEYISDYSKIYEKVFEDNRSNNIVAETFDNLIGYLWKIIEDYKNKDFFKYMLDDPQNNDNQKKYSERKYKVLYMDIQDQLSRTIYSKRKKHKMTQMQLSQLSGVDRSMIAKIERVQQPTTLETAIKLLSALGMRMAIIPQPANWHES